jgi:hypothetical protein
MLCRQPVSLCVAVVVAAALAAGCSGRTRLEVTSLKSGQLYSTEFAQAWASRSEQGQYDVVLDSQAGNQASSPSRSTGPTDQTSQPPLRHIVHMRVLWQPWSRPTADNPAMTNASIHWYVISQKAGGGVDMLRYDGTGVVRVFGGGDEARVRIYSAKLEPGLQAGLSDPVGQASLSSAFAARLSPRHVRQVLAQISALEPAGDARATIR